MRDILVIVHSLLRWLIMATAIFGTLRAALGLGGNRAYERLDNVISAVYTGVLDLQLLIGFILLATAIGTDRMPGLLHPLVAVLAVVVAHVGRRFAQRREGTQKHRGQLAGMAVSLVLLVIGVIALPTRPAPS